MYAIATISVHIVQVSLQVEQHLLEGCIYMYTLLASKPYRLDFHKYLKLIYEFRQQGGTDSMAVGYSNMQVVCVA